MAMMNATDRDQARDRDEVGSFLRRAREAVRRTGGEVEELRSELARACSLLERERAKYVDLFESTPEASVITDAAGAITDANVAAGALFGLDRRLLVGKPLIGFVARQHTRDFRSRLRELAAGPGDAHALSVRMRPRGGTVFVASLRVRVVRGPRAAAVALRWTIRASGAGREPNAGRAVDVDAGAS